MWRHGWGLSSQVRTERPSTCLQLACWRGSLCPNCLPRQQRWRTWSNLCPTSSSSMSPNTGNWGMWWSCWFCHSTWMTSLTSLRATEWDQLKPADYKNWWWGTTVSWALSLEHGMVQIGLFSTLSPKTTTLYIALCNQVTFTPGWLGATRKRTWCWSWRV